MAYLSLYRKYRSQTFGELVGQDHVVKTLQNALSSGRISHSYLFTGPRGTGKTSSARLLAKALNCENGPTTEPCNTCFSCLSITDGSAMDVHEFDAASEAGVEDVREKIVQVADYAPAMSRYRVIIIDEVHDLSGKAFDALLKTIEEPPSHLIFILATTEFSKVPPTIRSRCQKFEFHRGSIPDLIQKLESVLVAEGVEAEPSAIAAIARMSDGGYRDALTLLEQAMLTAQGKITLQQIYDQLGLVNDDVIDSLLVSVKERKIEELLRVYGDVIRLGRDPKSIVDSILMRIADLTYALYGIEVAGDGAANAARHEAATRIGIDQLNLLRAEFASIHKNLRDITLPRIWLESELLRLTLPKPEPTVRIAPQAEQTTQKPAENRTTNGTGGAAKSSEKPESASRAPEASRATAAVSVPMWIPQELTGDADLDKGIAIWNSARDSLAKANANAARKLAHTHVDAFQDTGLTIAFERNADYDTVVEGPNSRKAQELIKTHIDQAAGKTLSVRYIVKKGTPVASSEPTAVELPAEKQKLREMAEQVFLDSSSEE